MPSIPSIRAIRLFAAWLTLVASLVGVAAWAQDAPLDAVDVVAQPTADLLSAARRVQGAEGRVAFSTAPDAEGIVRRVEVRSRLDMEAGSEWLVFALANPSDRQVDRLVVAPRARLAGSGWWRPDLARARIAAITPSEGFALEPVADAEADIFQVTLDPGAVVTFAAELAAVPSELTVWAPDARRDALNAETLYHGIVLGVAGLLTTVLVVLTVVRGAPMFLTVLWFAAAALGFATLQFGFLVRALDLGPADQSRLQAWLELAVAAGFVLVPAAYLALHRFVALAGWVVLGWLGLLAGGAVLAAFDPPLAATLARLSIALATALGFLAALWLALTGFDRAQALLPTSLLAAAWALGGWALVTGRAEDALAAPALVGGLVLIAAMLTITVAQHALLPGAPARIDDAERRALALEGAGDAVFDWDVAADAVRVGPSATSLLGLPEGELDGSLTHFASHLHPEDRDRLRALAASLADRGRGRLDTDIRIRGMHRGTLGTARTGWFRLRLRPLASTDGRTTRCIGTLSDVTAERDARERLLQDAVHDSLTGLPNRELFVDRLRAGLVLAGDGEGPLKPAVFLIDLDRFAHINETFGVLAADNVLVAMARRLLNVVKPQDCLARLGADRFALLVLSEPDPEGLALLADRLQRAVRMPVRLSAADEEISVTASLGLVGAKDAVDGPAGRARAEAMIADAEIAVAEAKRLGGDRVEPFRPAMRSLVDRDYHVENDLRRALTRGEIEMHYQPIVDLRSDRIAGFEALMRWRSPARGLVGPGDFIPMAERNGLIVELGVFALDTAMGELARLRRAADDDTLFMSVNISSRQLMRHDLIADVKGVLDRAGGARDGLKLELTESLVMDSPEQAAIVLARVKELGASLALDDFGTGHSSLAQITRFSFDTIKIDRSLVRDREGETDPQRPIVLRALVTMAHELGMDVVAEGLEDEEDAKTVAALECRYGQGYLYGGSLEIADAEAALKRQTKRKARPSDSEDVPAVA